MAKTQHWWHSKRLRWILIVAFVLYTLGGFLLVPWIAERVIVSQAEKRLGRTPAIEKVRFNPFTLAMTIEGFELADRPGTTLLSFDRLYANAQVSSLFRWAATLKELRVEHPYAGLRRFEDGKINVVEVWEDFKARSEPREEERSIPRALLHQIAVTQGELEIEDRVAPEGEKFWALGPAELSLHEISTIPDKEGDQEVTLGLPDGGSLQMAGQLVAEPFQISGSLVLENLELQNAWRAVSDKFELALTEGRLATRLEYAVQWADDGLHLQVDNAEIGLSGVHVAEDDSGTELLRVDSAVVSNLSAQWPEQVVAADSVVVDGAFAQAWLEPDGTPSWEAWVPHPTRQQVVETYQYLDERIDAQARLGRFELRNADAEFEDRTLDVPQRHEITQAALTLTDVSTAPEDRWGLDTTATLAGTATAAAKGNVGISPMSLEADVTLEGLELAQFQPYVEKLVPLELTSGSLATAGKVRLAPDPEASKVTFEGELSVADLDLSETVTGGRLVAWREMKSQGIQAGLAPISLAIESIDLYEAGLEIVVAQNGEINLIQFVEGLGETGSGAAETSGAAAGEYPPARIDKIELHDCYGRYTSSGTSTPFETQLVPINGTITDVATDNPAGAKLEIEAVAEEGGLIRVAGTVDPFDYQRLSVIELEIDDFMMPPVSPVLISMIGFPAETGRTSVDSSVEVHDQQLVSTNHLEVDNLTLGEKVPGEGRINLPIKLGLSLLKDKDGKITLDVPVEGDLGNPEFLLLRAVESAAFGMIGEVAKSPFKLLARLGGGSDDQQLDAIDFSAGSAELETAAQANLTTLARALEQKDQLLLEIQGTYSAQVDAAPPTTSEEEVTPEPDDETSEAAAPQQAPEPTVEPTVEPADVADVPADETTEEAMEVAPMPLSEAELTELGTARAEAIRTFLVDEQGVDPARITILPAAAAAAAEAEGEAEGEEVQSASDRVSSTLTVTVAD